MSKQCFRRPQCPYCYNGEIVADNHVKGVYFCAVCHERVSMIKFKNWLENGEKND